MCETQKIPKTAKDWFVEMAAGDARQAIGVIENAHSLYGKITLDTLKETILIEREHPDPNLKIGKTKIYLLNLENALVLEALGSLREEVSQRQKLILELQSCIKT